MRDRGLAVFRRRNFASAIWLTRLPLATIPDLNGRDLMQGSACEHTTDTTAPRSGTG
jgi:hypothetical protein